MTNEELWPSILQALSELPSWRQRLAALDATALIKENALNIESKPVDASYIEFLNQQIKLEPRGPEWTEKLKKRVAALTPYIGKTITTAMLSYQGDVVTIKIDPELKKAINVEEN